MPRSQCEKENVQLVQELAEVDGPFESPININFRDLIQLELPSLTWNKPDAVPKKMKITNTGHTVIISGKWKCERPYLTGGPLDGKYVFSQIHFHWGPDNCKGSEHQVSGESFPLEMHVAHFKTEYMTQESALHEKDGMVVLVYLFKLQDEPNASLKKIISTLPCVRQANSSQQLECRSILALCNPFSDDYFMYWGSVVTSTCAHILLWIVCREPFGISRDQMEEFRKILDASHFPIRRNSREPQPLHKRNVFHVNASKHLDEPMLPIKNIFGCFCSGSDREVKESKKSGDGNCGCNQKLRIQEELEDKQDARCKRESQKCRGNGVYLQQTVYFQHATVHSVPALPKTLPEEESQDKSTAEELQELNSKANEVSQSCCFFSIENEKKPKGGGKLRAEKGRERIKRPMDSVTTLANLIDTLETLKTQTYKKLKEIETINRELRGMRSSCDNLEERQWLRHAEKILSRQKRFTIRSSQCCLSDLKKLAKECNFDKLWDDKILSGADDAKTYFMSEKTTDSAVLYSNPSGDRAELHEIDSSPLSLCNQERFSRKAQKLIRSFFEDIKETEEAQINLEKNILLKKFEKLSKKKMRSDLSNASTVSIAPRTQMQVTKNMMNMGQIREQFFTEVSTEDKSVAERNAAPAVKKKKKNRSFFKISLSGFENDKPLFSGKNQKKTLFRRSALDWLNNRLNYMSDTSPVIPLRITDIELKTGNIYGALKKKSKQSIKGAVARKVVSDEHVRTEVSTYVSESLISEYSDKSKYSRQSKTQRSIIREMEKTSHSRKKSERSIAKIIKDLDTNNFFVQLGNSADISTVTSTDSEKKDDMSAKRKSRRDLWENGSSTISGIRREFTSKREICTLDNYYEKTEDVEFIKTTNDPEDPRDGRLYSSSDSSIVITRRSTKEILNSTVISRATSWSNAVRSRDVSVDATEDRSTDGPKKKKLKVEWKCKSFDVQPKDTSTEVHAISYIETECHKVTYVESECQADLNPVSTAKTKTCGSSPSAIYKFPEWSRPRSPLQFDIESQTEQSGQSAENVLKQRMSKRDTSVDVILPIIAEDEKKTDEESKFSETQSRQKEMDELLALRERLATGEHCRENWREATQTSPKSAELGDSGDGVQVQTEFIAEPPKRVIIFSKSIESCDEVDDIGTMVPPIEVEETISSPDEKCVSPVRTESLFFATPDLTEEEREREGSERRGDKEQMQEERSGLLIANELNDSENVSRNVSQNELSECNEEDLLTDSNGTPNYQERKKLTSRDTTPSILSTDDEKQESRASAIRLMNQQKPFSAESINSLKNAYDVIHKKRRQCMKKKSKQLLRRNNSVMRKFSKIGGSNIDFTNLTEEEQLKIISANVARFVKQKLVEHKNFFDFDKNEPMTIDLLQWSKADDQLTMVNDEPETEKFDGQSSEPEPEPEPKVEAPAEKPQTLPTPVPPLPLPEEQKPEREPEPEATADDDDDDDEDDGGGKDVPAVKEEAAVEPEQIAEDAGKNEAPRQPPLDFIKLNKMLAGKYKRRIPTETGKKGTKIPGKVSRKEDREQLKKELIKTSPTRKPMSAGKSPTKTGAARSETPPVGAGRRQADSPTGRSVRPPSADATVRPAGMQKTIKPPGSPLPGHQRDASGSPKPTKRVERPPPGVTPPSPKPGTLRARPTTPLGLQRPNQPKKRLIPTYTLTSYLSPPNDVLGYQKTEFDKYLKQKDISDLFAGDMKKKCMRKAKRGDGLSKKNLDYLIMLQKRINHEISANIENSMNYVKTLLSQDYNGTAIIEKAPVKNSMDVFEPGAGGIVFIEMNDQYDCSSSSSEFSEESGLYCIYQGKAARERSRKFTREIFLRRNESGDPGLIDSRLFEELQNDTDSSYNYDVSVVGARKTGQEDKFADADTGDRRVSDVLNKYIYHLGGGEDVGCRIQDAPPSDESSPVKRRKRKERVLDIPKEMKLKLVDMLEEEMKGDDEGAPEVASDPTTDASDASPRGGDEPSDDRPGDADADIVSIISEMMIQYLDECEGDEQRCRKDEDTSRDYSESGDQQMERTSSSNP